MGGDVLLSNGATVEKAHDIIESKIDNIATKIDNIETRISAKIDEKITKMTIICIIVFIVEYTLVILYLVCIHSYRT